MKKSIILLFLGMWVMGFFYNLHANVDPYPAPKSFHKVIVKMNLDPLSNAFTLQLANLEKMRTHILLEDIAGRVWYSEYVWGEKGFAERFNMEGVPDGDYLLFIGNRNMDYVQLIAIRNGELALFDQHPFQPVFEEGKGFAVLTSLKPATAKRGRLITFLSRPDNQTLGIQLANLQERPFNLALNRVGGGTMYKVSESGVHGFAQKLNMTGMQEGFYYVYIETQGKTIVQFFHLDDDKGGILFDKVQSFKPPVNPKSFTLN